MKYARCPECRHDTLTVSSYPDDCSLVGAVEYACMNADCGWELSLDAAGRAFDEESIRLELDLACLRLEASA